MVFPRLKAEFTMSLSVAQNSLNDSSSSILISLKLVASLWSFESLTASVHSQVVWRIVHASFAVSMEDIFLNSSFVIALSKTFNALLLKFVALILASSQSAGAFVGLVQPISITYHTFSSNDYKKAPIRTFQYAQLVSSNK